MLRALRRRLPRISATEREALAAGTVWLDGEIFRGDLDWGELLREAYPRLREDERAFLDGPVEEVCVRIRESDMGEGGTLPEPIWQFLRREGFFGLVIPPEHGGLGFTPLGASAVFGKLATRSLGLSAIVLIPNSVGPGELLLEHGTEEQKAHFLPRLARGEEIPCFALTEPEAGSDAASLTSRGVVFRGEDGKPHLRLDWEKRYITLAPVATLLGLAFRLEDPENLLRRGEEPGITVALVDTSLPGVEIGARHDPLGIPFPNGPTRGRDVVLPVDRILGGPPYAGRGWQILMEALAGGRAISLPAQAVAGMKYLARITGAYASVREQFGTPIARFEGIEERLARLGGYAYLGEAARVFTCGAVGTGERPAVISAVAKYSLTELAREAARDAMDVLGGAAICEGPRNLVARAWHGAPIGITVEGANILTRTLIVFGQGILRSHPFARPELDAVEREDAAGLARALVGHALHFLANLARVIRFPWTAGPLLGLEPVPASLRPHARRLSRAAARFALWSDLALFTQGARLKRRGRLAGHMADQIAWTYLGLAVIRRFEAEGRPAEDLPLARWGLEEALDRIQRAHEGALASWSPGLFGRLARGPLAFLGRLRPLGRGPTEPVIRAAAAAMRTPGPARDRLTDGVFLPTAADEPLVRLEEALQLEDATRDLRKRSRSEPESLSDEDRALLERYETLRSEVLAVDEFPSSGETNLAPSGRSGRELAAGSR